MVPIENVEAKIFVSECREAASGSSPGWSADELRESSGTRGYTSTTAQATIDRFSNPINLAESQSDGCRLPAAHGAQRVVGFAGCDSVESSEVVNRLLVAERDVSITPGLRLARKASRRSPGATSGRQLRGSEKEGCKSFLVNV